MTSPTNFIKLTIQPVISFFSPSQLFPFLTDVPSKMNKFQVLLKNGIYWLSIFSEHRPYKFSQLNGQFDKACESVINCNKRGNFWKLLWLRSFSWHWTATQSFAWHFRFGIFWDTYVCCVFISNADAQACVNTNITSWTGDITSPGYGSYQPNLDCYWLIQVAEGNVVEIEFQDFSVRNGRNFINFS